MEYVRSFKPPANVSAAYGAVCGDEVLFEEGIGCVSQDTMFAMASISKVVVATLALQAVERQEISLDEDINAYLPPNVKAIHPLFATTRISARILLQHKSGLCDDETALLKGPWRSEDTDCPVTLAEYIQARLSGTSDVPAARQWLGAHEAVWSGNEPGVAPYHYSNLGITILALALETACKCPLPALASTRIFEPLGMTRSSFTLAGARAIVSRQDGVTIAQPHAWAGAIAHYGVAEWPAAGLRASVSDLLRFLRLFTGPPSPVLSQASIATMLPTDFRGGLAWWGRDAAYGKHDEDVWTHGGYMQGVRSHVYLWPQHRRAMVCVLNGEGVYESLAKSMQAVIFAASRE